MSNRTEAEWVTRFPMRLVRVANFFLRWTKWHCSGGCGYPVTGKYEVQIDEYEGVPVVMLVCSLGGECERNVRDDPPDEKGFTYADVRPHLKDMTRDADKYRLSLTG